MIVPVDLPVVCIKQGGTQYQYYEYTRAGAMGVAALLSRATDGLSGGELYERSSNMYSTVRGTSIHVRY